MKRYDWDAAFNGETPVNPQAFEGYMPYTPPPVDHTRYNNERKVLRRLGLFCGLALTGYLVVQNALYILMYIFGFLETYDTDPFYQSAIDIVLTVLGLFLPYAFFGRFMEKTALSAPLPRPQGDILGFKKPKSAFDFFLALLSGIGFCMIANIITSYFSVIMYAFGFELSSPDLVLPSGIGGILLTLLKVSILAAFSEEICLRGYTMGSLRVFGDKPAILFSAVVFALMHGNLIQSPFALIAGLAIGYLTVKTESLWTGIAIHAANNAVSVLVSYSVDYLGEDKANALYSLLIYAFIFIGLLAFSLFFMRTKNKRLTDGDSLLTLGQKASAFFLNAPMLLAAAYMLYVTSTYISSVVPQ